MVIGYYNNINTQNFLLQLQLHKVSWKLLRGIYIAETLNFLAIFNKMCRAKIPS